jgi:hypothetical protein
VLFLIQNKYQLIVNIKSKGYTGAIPSVTANDNIVFDILVYDGATSFDLTGVSRFTLVSMRKDNISVIREGTLVNGMIEFVLGSSETLENGRVDATVQLYDADNKRVSSAPLVYNVIGDPSLSGSLPADDKTLVMANESLLTDAINKANNADTRISNIVAQAGSDNTEIVDARQKADGTTYTSLHDRLNASDVTMGNKANQTDLNTTNNNMGDLTTLQTTDKSSLVHAINENVTHLAQSAQQKKFYDYVSYLAKSANLSRKMSVIMGNPAYKYFDVSIPTSDVDGINYHFGKDTNDDFQLLLNGDYGTLVNTNSISEAKNNETESLSGTYDKGYPPNYWTGTVGNYIAATFIGTKISFNSYCNNQGGLWHFILDEGTAGQQTIDISVYRATAAILEQVLFQNLDYKKHTIKGVFQGQDPANPIASPRGWWYYGGTRPQDTSRTFNIYNDVSYVSPTVKCLYSYTVKEFALSCRPYGTTEAYTYIPEHTSPTAYKVDEPILLLDGKVPVWNSGIIYPNVECVQLIQHLKGYHPSDLVNALMDIKIIQTIKNGVYSVSGYITFLRKTEMDVGYAIMAGYDLDLSKKIKTGGGNVFTVKTDGSKEYLPDDDKSYSFCIYNDVDQSTRGNIAIACTVDNQANTQRVDKTDRGVPFSWVEHRNASMGKAYMQQFKNAVAEVGDVYRFDGRYMICVIPKVNNFII